MIMITKLLWYPQKQTRRFINICNVCIPDNFKVTIIGGAGRVGQSAALHLKQCSLLKQLCIYDGKNAKGIVADLSHIDTDCQVRDFTGPKKLKKALEDAHIVVLAAGAPYNKGQSSEQQFKANAKFINEVTKLSADACPNSLIVVATNPVNSLVPLVCATLEHCGMGKPNKIFGLTSLNSVRANAFVAQVKCIDPRNLNVPLIGGNCSKTLIPLFSQLKCIQLSNPEIKVILERLQNADCEVIEAKQGKGTATLTPGYAIAKFVVSLLRAFSGDCNVIETAYVKSCVTDSKYFASKIKLGKLGVEKHFALDKLACFEQLQLKKALGILKKDIELGENFANKAADG